jgi:hypothetical protein
VSHPRFRGVRCGPPAGSTFSRDTVLSTYNTLNKDYGTTEANAKAAGRSARARRSAGLLLGHAVHGAEAPDQVSGVDGHYLAGGEELSQSVEGDAVVRVVEDRN